MNDDIELLRGYSIPEHAACILGVLGCMTWGFILVFILLIFGFVGGYFVVSRIGELNEWQQSVELRMYALENLTHERNNGDEQE